MTYVGLAASASVYLEIPIVLRSLATSFGHLPEDDLPIEFDIGFISLLEIGTRPTDPFSLISSYKQPWWKGCRTTKQMGIIREETLKDHLSYYHEELRKKMHKNDITPSINDTAVKPLFTPRNEGHAEGLLEVIQRTLSLVDGLHVSATSERDLGMRRTAAFLMLHEASVSTDTEHREAEGTGKGKEIDVETNTKWVTGTALTRQQAIEILEGRRRSQHEGYIHDMPEGILDGEYSEVDSLADMTLSGSIFTVESASVNDVPPDVPSVDWSSILNTRQPQFPGWPPSNHPDSAAASGPMKHTNSSRSAVQKSRQMAIEAHLPFSAGASAHESDAMDIDVIVRFTFFALRPSTYPSLLSAECIFHFTDTHR